MGDRGSSDGPITDSGPAFGIGDIGGRLGRHLLEGRRQRQSPSAPMSNFA